MAIHKIKGQYEQNYDHSSKWSHQVKKHKCIADGFNKFSEAEEQN